VEKAAKRTAEELIDLMSDAAAAQEAAEVALGDPHFPLPDVLLHPVPPLLPPMDDEEMGDRLAALFMDGLQDRF